MGERSTSGAERTVVAENAEALLVLALEQVRDGEDAIATIEQAADLLRVEAGELPLDDVADFEPACICPPELVARGGFKGGCPVHA